MVLEKTLESPLDCTIKPVHPKGDQPWIFIGRTDAEAPILWPPDEKSWLIGKDRDSGKDWGQQKSVTEDEMVGWHHRLNRQEFEHTPGVDEGQLQSMGSQRVRLRYWTTIQSCKDLYLGFLKTFMVLVLTFRS